MFIVVPLFWCQNKDVTEAIQKVAAAYDCKIVEGVLSHQLKQFVIDGNKVVLSVSNPDTRVDDAEFEENEVYAIDIVTSTGDGKVIEESSCERRYHPATISDCLQKFLCQTCSLSCWMKSKQLSTRELSTRTIT